MISSSGALIGSFAQQLGADETQTKQIIADIINSNLKNVLESDSGQNPKLLAHDTAMRRIKSLERSERIIALQWLTPWLREFGMSSIFRALKQYLSLKALARLRDGHDQVIFPERNGYPKGMGPRGTKVQTSAP